MNTSSSQTPRLNDLQLRKGWNAYIQTEIFPIGGTPPIKHIYTSEIPDETYWALSR